MLRLALKKTLYFNYFFNTIFEIFLTLIPLKLLWAKQNKLINKLLERKSIVLNDKNNSNNIFIKIFKKIYIHIYQSKNNLP